MEVADARIALAPVADTPPPPAQSLSTPSSPVKGSTLLQRQMSRALDYLERNDGEVRSGGDAGTTTTTVVGTSPLSASADSASAVHVSYRTFKTLVKKCPKTIFQISPNAVKRKRSHSMSSITSGKHPSRVHSLFTF